MPPRGAYVGALAEGADRRRADPVQAALVPAVLAQHAADLADVAAPALGHEDLNPVNVPPRRSRGRWGIAAVVDFDGAWAGCPDPDFARPEPWRGMTDPAFWAGYAAGVAGRRRPAARCSGCSGARRTADTARVVAALGVPPTAFG